VEFAFTVIKPRVLKRYAVVVAATPDGVFHVEFKRCRLSLAQLHAGFDRLLGLDNASARASTGANGSLNGNVKSKALVEKAARELEDYLERKLRKFSVPLDMETLGSRSAFDRKVWLALRKVPYGSVTTYGNLASRIGRPGAARAVGAAVGRNPLPILIPCHRVVGRDGRLTGFSSGLPIKKTLLGIEGLRLTGAARMEDRRVLPAGAPGRAAPAPAGPSRRARKPRRHGRLS
jgi:methylated-DNA-[protein]-cysteine S-methyltransferase